LKGFLFFKLKSKELPIVFFNSMQIRFHIIILLFSVISINAVGQSPSSLLSNISLSTCGCTAFAGSNSATFNSDAQIATAFNFGRRAEETQLNLTPNILGDMILPSNYASLSESQKGLLLINLERQARAGIDYDGAGAQGPVLGLPFEGLEPRLNNLAQVHADYLNATNTFSHLGADGADADMTGDDPFTRIETEFGTEKEFMGRSENIYASCGGYNSHLIEQAIFT
jgi:hypothetical protein